MPNEPQSAPDETVESVETPAPETPAALTEDAVADFITRNVLEKDAAFFEG